MSIQQKTRLALSLSLASWAIVIGSIYCAIKVAS